jgi:hypothetical protein
MKLLFSLLSLSLLFITITDLHANLTWEEKKKMREDKEAIYQRINDESLRSENRINLLSRIAKDHDDDLGRRIDDLEKKLAFNQKITEDQLKTIDQKTRDAFGLHWNHLQSIDKRLRLLESQKPLGDYFEGIPDPSQLRRQPSSSSSSPSSSSDPNQQRPHWAAAPPLDQTWTSNSIWSPTSPRYRSPPDSPAASSPL